MRYLIPFCAATLVLGACAKKDESHEGPTTAAPAAPAESTSTSAPPPARPSATAQLAPTQGHNAAGVLTLSSDGGVVKVSGNITGLPPNAEFGFHIHEKGDCSAPDASSAGAHFNPSGAEHGNPTEDDAHHAGDMLNAKSDAQGTAQVDVDVNHVTLGGGTATDVVGKAIVMHEKPDDYKTQPSGNSGARIACGVITAG